MNSSQKQSLIGVFDSGVGGLSVLQPMRRALPHEGFIYFADQAHVPYGPRSKQEILAFSRGIVDFLLGQGAKLIVLACNTASAAALHTLREDHPRFPFVGMEPAVKPAVRFSKSGVVGVLATPSTFEGELYASVVGRFAQDAKLLKHTCPGLVEEIEAGRANGSRAKAILKDALGPMLAQGLDSVVLGCTHYAFASEGIREITGPQVHVIDPAPAIARRVDQLLEERGLRAPSPQAGNVRYLTTGDAGKMRERVLELLGEKAEIEKVGWRESRLV